MDFSSVISDVKPCRKNKPRYVRREGECGDWTGAVVFFTYLFLKKPDGEVVRVREEVFDAPHGADVVFEMGYESCAVAL